MINFSLISITSLLNHDDQATTSQSEAIIKEITKGYLNYVHNHVKPFLVPMHEHVYECIQAGLTTLDGMDNDLESLYEGDISPTPPPIINGLTALEDLSHYFHSLSISLLPSVPGTPSTNISDLVKLLSTTRQSPHQHLESQKKQSNLDGWVQHLS